MEMDGTAAPYRALVRAAARSCRCPTAVLCRLGAGGQRVLADTGLAGRDTGAEQALREQLIRAGGPLLVRDTGPGAGAGPRFFAGVPLLGPARETVGCLYVLDQQPRPAGAEPLQADPLETLTDLATAAVALLDPPASPTALEAAPIGYLEVTLDLVITLVNPELCRLLGYRTEELLGGPLSRLGAATDPAELEAVSHGDLPSARFEQTYRRCDGSPVPALVTVVPRRDRSGAVCGLAAVLLANALPPGDQPGPEERTGDERAAHVARAGRQEFLSALLDTIDVGILACDVSGRVAVWNKALTAFRPDGAQGWVALADWPATYHLYRPDGALLTEAELPLARILLDGSATSCELVLAPPGQPPRRLRADGRLVRAPDGSRLGAVVTVQDVTRANAREAELAHSEERFRLGFHASPLPAALLDATGRIVEVNGALCRWLGYPPAALLGESIDLVTPPADRPAAHQRLRRHLQPGSPPAGGEREYIAADGSTVQGLLSVVRLDAPDGEPLVLVQLEDLTQRRSVERELARMSVHDPLTGLPSRVLFGDRIEQALARCQRIGQPLAVLYCDLDAFSLVNAGLGRGAGDEVLAGVAERIVRAVRPEDTVSRLGGDEFAILAEGIDTEEAAALARRIRRYLTIPVPVRGDETVLTVSIGVAGFPAGGDRRPSPDELLRDAEAAMHRAKRLGKNRHTVFDAALRAEASARTSMEALVRAALADGGVEPHYQPVYDLASGVPIGVEALARLRTPTGKLILPGSFIGIAEDCGLIVPLGQRMLTLACAQSVHWQRTGLGELSVAVNVAAQQAGREDFAQTVFDALAAAGLPPRRLVLELTESALLEATPQTLFGLRQLREAGVGVAIDDFGTQYASLRYVQRFPASQLKIDLSFVAGLPDGKADRAIVETVADLARRLDLECVAEGIETPAQLAVLRPMGILGQGYLLGRPAEPEQLAAMLRDSLAWR